MNKHESLAQYVMRVAREMGQRGLEEEHQAAHLLAEGALDPIVQSITENRQSSGALAVALNNRVKEICRELVRLNTSGSKDPVVGLPHLGGLTVLTVVPWWGAGRDGLSCGIEAWAGEGEEKIDLTKLFSGFRGFLTDPLLSGKPHKAHFFDQELHKMFEEDLSFAIYQKSVTLVLPTIGSHRVVMWQYDSGRG